MIYIKSSEDIEKIKVACKIWKEVREALIKETKVGVSLKQLDNIANDIITKNNAIPAFHGYMGFPSYICISVNEQLIHGIATNYILKKDDLVTFDIGVKYDDHFCDSAFSINLNPANTKNQAILDATKECLDESIKLAVAGNKTGDLGNKIEEVAQKHGYEVIKDYGGHGCGNKIHEDPFIMCYGKKNTGIKLVPGMVICIEPMLLTGTDKYYIDPKNNWTVIALNHKLTCHYEHMILIKEEGNEILTL